MYRIYTKDKNRDGIHAILEDEGFDSYTLIEAFGTYRGTHERSLIIEIETGETREKIERTAGRIGMGNNQDTVMVVWIPASVTFV